MKAKDTKEAVGYLENTDDVFSRRNKVLRGRPETLTEEQKIWCRQVAGLYPFFKRPSDESYFGQAVTAEPTWELFRMAKEELQDGLVASNSRPMTEADKASFLKNWERAEKLLPRPKYVRIG